MLKYSIYNHFYEEAGVFLGINCMSRQTVSLALPIISLIRKNDIQQLEDTYCEVFNDLVTKNFIVDDQINEYEQLVRRRRYYVNNLKHYHLVILPTQECNFHCWYCYEQHEVGRLTEISMHKIELYVDYIIGNYELDEFTLEWFGGEPLICFESTIIPLSIYIRDLCKHKEIKFNNTITTNAYLLTPEKHQKLFEIELFRYQITLDGSRYFHNKIKPNSYDTIVSNITSLLENILEASVVLRINYTNKMLKSTQMIAQEFDNELRNRITVMYKRIWQTNNNETDDIKLLNQLEYYFRHAGYSILNISLLSAKGYRCISESALQSVVNYNLRLYKCTAREFNDTNSVGRISTSGKPLWNGGLKSFIDCMPFQVAECMSCNILPLCLGMCTQKYLESKQLLCKKARLIAQLNNHLLLTLKTYKNETAKIESTRKK